MLEDFLTTSFLLFPLFFPKKKQTISLPQEISGMVILAHLQSWK